MMDIKFRTQLNSAALNPSSAITLNAAVKLEVESAAIFIAKIATSLLS